ncbi:hypothetical protein LCGC14_1322740 [marine sediment metagenome]|uniref:Helix-turn-helix type 11 domain-containing protein n=1 Tax=marine sediment metagenome TaxID=412755 RepID=A0A0F9MZT2_9ZZZZ
MSQDSVLRLLENSEKPLSVKEIREKLDLRSAGRNLKKLKEQGDIKQIWLLIKLRGGRNQIVERPVQHYYV